MADSTTIAAARENVTTFYRTLLGREPGTRNDPTGLDGWTTAFVNLYDNVFKDGTPAERFERAKAEIHQAFVNSDEYKARQQGTPPQPQPTGSTVTLPFFGEVPTVYAIGGAVGLAWLLGLFDSK